MNEKLYQKWIEALESNSYTHTPSVLKNLKNEFCCLGVLCNIYDSTNWTDYTDDDYSTYLSHEYTLPQILVDELNLTSDMGHFKTAELSAELQQIIEPYTGYVSIDSDYKEYTSTLIEINDLDPNPFPIIAKILRERPRSLFKNE